MIHTHTEKYSDVFNYFDVKSHSPFPEIGQQSFVFVYQTLVKAVITKTRLYRQSDVVTENVYSSEMRHNQMSI